MESVYFSIKGMHGFMGFLFVGEIPVFDMKIACLKTEETQRYTFEPFEQETSLDEIVKKMLKKKLNYEGVYYLDKIPKNTYTL